MTRNKAVPKNPIITKNNSRRPIIGHWKSNPHNRLKSMRIDIHRFIWFIMIKVIMDEVSCLEIPGSWTYDRLGYLFLEGQPPGCRFLTIWQESRIWIYYRKCRIRHDLIWLRHDFWIPKYLWFWSSTNGLGQVLYPLILDLLSASHSWSFRTQPLVLSNRQWVFPGAAAIDYALISRWS